MSAPARTGTGGRHFLQIPGPTNVPDRVLRAMAAPTIDHRGPQSTALGLHVLEAVKPVFGTTGRVVIHPAAGAGACEAALVNTRSPGDEVLCWEARHVATLWGEMARRLGPAAKFEHDGLPLPVAEDRLFPAVRAASQDAVVAATAVSGRQQIHHGTQRTAQHPVGLLLSALAEPSP